MLKNNVLGIVFSNMHEEVLPELTGGRTTGSVPFGGRYRFIDFTLSNMVNAGIYNVGVVTKSNYYSLMEHLGSGREWGLARKLGGLTVLPPFSSQNAGIYRGRVEALSGALDYIRGSGAEYVVLADCDVIGNIDYEPIVNAHIESGAEITVAYVKSGAERAHRADTCALTLDADSYVSEVLIRPQGEEECNLYLNICVMRADHLAYVVRSCMSRNLYSFSHDVLQALAGGKKIFAYRCEESATIVDSLETYLYASLKLLEPAVRDQLFTKDRPIYTRVHDEVPVRYGIQAKVKNSLIADGAIIEGEVENCIIGRGVKIGRGAKVSNCVLMQGTTVSDGAQLSYIVADRQVLVKDNRVLAGYMTYPLYLAKQTIV